MKAKLDKPPKTTAKTREERGYTCAGMYCRNCRHKRWVAINLELRCFYDGASVDPDACCTLWEAERE